MKIYLLKRKNIVLYSFLILCVAVILIIGNSNAKSVFNEGETEKLLPIYSVDRGDEKVCSLTFDAAWDDGILGLPLWQLRAVI